MDQYDQANGTQLVPDASRLLQARREPDQDRRGVVRPPAHHPYRLEKIGDISGLSVFETEHKERLGLDSRPGVCSPPDRPSSRRSGPVSHRPAPPRVVLSPNVQKNARSLVLPAVNQSSRLRLNSFRPQAKGVGVASIDTGDTAWMLISTALVLLMTPGLAFFYGGLVRRKNVLSIMMQCFILIGVISIQWVLFGYSLAFGPSQGGFIGGLSYLGLSGVSVEPNADYAATIPHVLFMLFQMMFAVITPALIIGAFAERMKFSAFLVFSLLWATIVYDPMAHWVWGVGGWLRELGALDFAGGPWCTSTQGPRHSPPRWSSASGRAIRTRLLPTTCRSRSSARRCSGSVGSVSTRGAR